MPRYSKYMLRKWEAWVPLPPQPEGPKPTSPTSHESAPTTRLEATLGGGSSSTPALKRHRSAARNFRLRRPGGGEGRGERGGSVCLMPKPGSEDRHRGAGSPGSLLTPLTFVIRGGLHADCGLRHPTSSSLLGTMTLGKSSSKMALRRVERVFPPGHPCP